MSASKGDASGYEMKPEEIAREALKSGARSVSYTYTEPTVFFEYAYETSKKTSEKGLSNIFVTNGYMTSEALGKVSPFLSAVNVDLKFFNDDTYRKVCGASLFPVLETISRIKNSGIWLEVTTLVIPGLNDSERELRDTARFLASLSKDIPWHVSSFHPDHMMMDVPPTSPVKIEEAKIIGHEEGLKYVYGGNVPNSEKTICQGCGTVLIERRGHSANILDGFSPLGECPKCRERLVGVFS